LKASNKLTSSTDSQGRTSNNHRSLNQDCTLSALRVPVLEDRKRQVSQNVKEETENPLPVSDNSTLSSTDSTFFQSSSNVHSQDSRLFELAVLSKQDSGLSQQSEKSEDLRDNLPSPKTTATPKDEAPSSDPSTSTTNTPYHSRANSINDRKFLTSSTEWWNETVDSQAAIVNPPNSNSLSDSILGLGLPPVDITWELLEHSEEDENEYGESDYDELNDQQNTDTIFDKKELELDWRVHSQYDEEESKDKEELQTDAVDFYHRQENFSQEDQLSQANNASQSTM